MTDLEARVQALEHYVYVLATSLKQMQVRQSLESSLTNARFCECVERDEKLVKQCTEGFLSLTHFVRSINQRLSDGDDGWRSGATDL